MDTKTEKPLVYFTKTENQMLKNEKSANRNENKNRKTEVFRHENQKAIYKLAQTAKLKIPMNNTCNHIWTNFCHESAIRPQAKACNRFRIMLPAPLDLITCLSFLCVCIINFYWSKVTYIFPLSNKHNSHKQTDTIHHVFTYAPHSSSLLLLFSASKYNTSTVQQQHKILYTSNCFYTCPISYCELLVYYLIMRSLSQVGELNVELHTYVEGRDLFCQQEYKYCLAIITVWFINNSSSQGMVFYLYPLIIKPLCNLSPEILSVTTTNKKVLQGFVRFSTEGTRQRWNNTNFV